MSNPVFDCSTTQLTPRALRPSVGFFIALLNWTPDRVTPWDDSMMINLITWTKLREASLFGYCPINEWQKNVNTDLLFTELWEIPVFLYHTFFLDGSTGRRATNAARKSTTKDIVPLPYTSYSEEILGITIRRTSSIRLLSDHERVPGVESSREGDEKLRWSTKDEQQKMGKKKRKGRVRCERNDRERRKIYVVPKSNDSLIPIVAFIYLFDHVYSMKVIFWSS